MSLWSDELSLLDEVCRDAALLGSGAAFGSFLSIESCDAPRNRAGETTMNISNAFTGLASFTAQAGQTGVTTYGGRVGLNYMIN
jgi:hypothetical protein